MKEPDLKILESMIIRLNKSVTKEDFVAAFKNVVDIVLKIRKEAGDNRDTLKKEFTLLSQKLRDVNKDDFNEVRSEIRLTLGGVIDKMVSENNKTLAEFEKFFKKINEAQKSFENLKNEILVDVEKTKPQPETAIETKNKIESLTGDNRVNKSAIKGIEEIEQGISDLRARPIPGRSLGFRGIQLYVDGSKKGLIQYLNLIPGVGITLSYDFAHGRNDITINASASGLSKLTATGTVDDSNTQFTFVSKPTIIVVNGASYQEDHGWSWDAGTLTATLDGAPGIGGDVYGLG